MNRLVRFIIIQKILLKHGLERLVWSHPFFKPFSFFKIFFPHRWFKPQTLPTGQNIREALVELGPIFVKFGQLLSTRRDLLSDDFACELSKLQDKVPPFDGQIAKQLIEKRFGKPLHDIFAVFEETPVASASIAQVHRAQLKSQEWVAVKVLRPKIYEQIKIDVELLTFFAKLVHKAFPPLRRFRPCDVVKEFQHTLYNELDLLREAANATQLRRNFAHSTLIYIPEIYWDYCHKDILVSQFIEGIPVSAIDSLKKINVNLKLLAERGVEIFFTQVFRDCFFHADMHAGNIFIDATEPDNPRYIAVDFGIMGSLSPNDQKYLATNFLAFFKRDYRKVAELHIDSGWIPSNVRVDELEASIRTVCEPIFEKPLKDISFGRSLLRLFQTARKFDMEIQPQLLLLQKTLLSVEGLGKQLYPELDLWHTAKPFLERWMKTHMGPKALIKQMREKLPFWFYKMPQLPEVLYDLVQHWHQEVALKEKRHLLQKSVRNIIFATCSGILLLGGIFMIGFSHIAWVLQYPVWIGSALCLLAIILFVLPLRQ